MNINKNINILTSTEENHLNIHDTSLEVELNVSANAIDACRLVNYVVMAQLVLSD